MLIHKRQPVPRAHWIQRHRSWRWGFSLLLLALVFLAGALAHRAGYLRSWRLAFAAKTNINYYQALVSAPKLPTIQIDMKFKHYAKIERKRREALEAGILLTSKQDFVPAEIQFDGRTLPVKMRLKGDWVDHLRGDKWSFRIRIRGEGALFGMRRFSIQHPDTRNYVNEFAFLKHLRREGILAPRYRFVNVVFNGSEKGIYALEEHFSKELLESQGRREGVIIKFDERALWRKWRRMGRPGRSNLEPDDFRGTRVSAFRDSRIERDPVLRTQRAAAIGLLRAFVEKERSVAEVWDTELMGRFLALCEWWSASHGLAWHNLRFYYNPITARLEPVGFDAQPQDVAKQGLLALSELPEMLLGDPAVAETYLATLGRLCQAEALTGLRAELEDRVDEQLRALHREWPELREPWSVLQDRQEHLRRLLAPAQPVLADFVDNVEPDDGAGGQALTVAVANVLRLPVEVIGFRINGEMLIEAGQCVNARVEEGAVLWKDDGSILLLGRAQQSPVRWVDFRVPWSDTSASGKGSEPAVVTVATRLLGLTDVISVRASRVYPLPPDAGPGPRAPTLSEVLATHPFLVVADDRTALHIRPGDWTVEGDLILPQGMALEAGPGTTLRFAPGAVLLASGPLKFQGTADSPVVLAPTSASWAGLAVINVERPSTWKHVTVSGTAGIDRNGWYLTGGVTFYRSPIGLFGCRLLGSTAEDGINIVSSEFEFKDSEFGACRSDAFDGDYVTGVIQNCSFHDAGGDAIDLSGADVHMLDITVRDVVDKGISVGENSHVVLERFLSEHTGIAIASKDLSRVEVYDAAIHHTRIGIAVYSKKPEFGPSSLVGHNVRFSFTEQRALVQSACRLDLNGERFAGETLDVEQLYEKGVLGN